MTGKKLDLEELVIQKKDLEEAISTLSHEIRNSLAVIMGRIGIILDNYQLKGQVKKELEKVLAQARHSNQLITNVHYFNTLNLNNLKYERFNLSDIVSGIATLLETSDSQRHVDFRIAPNVFVYADRTAFEIMMQNFLGNAYKFTGKQQHAVIEFGVIQKEDGTIYYVRDNGAGFDQAGVDKLFKPRQRLHSRQDFNGTGYGLSTTKKVIDLHNGTVWAEGEVGKGATFYFTLPSKPQS